MKDPEIWMSTSVADGDVIPNEVVVLRVTIQPLPEASLARSDGRRSAFEGVNESSHGVAVGDGWIYISILAES